MSTTAYESSFKQSWHCTDDVTYHVTPPVQCDGLFKNKSWYLMGSEFEALHFTSPTTLQTHFSTAFHCTALLQLHGTASPLLHCIVFTAMYHLYSTARHCTALPTLHNHNSTACHYTATPLLHWISLHCSRSTPLHPLYFTALHPLHCTPILPCTLLTTLQHHYSTVPELLNWTSLLCAVLYNALHQDCMPLQFTTWISVLYLTQCSAIQCTEFHTSPSLHGILLNSAVLYTALQ